MNRNSDTRTISPGNQASAVNSALRKLSSVLFRPVPRRTQRSINRFVSLLVIVSMLLSPFAGLSVYKPYTARADDPGTPLPPEPEVRDVAPVTDPHLPMLVMRMEVTPRTVSVGDYFTVTLTLTNEAPDAANNVSVWLPQPGYPEQLVLPVVAPLCLPVPAGTFCYRPDLDPPGWLWQQSSLAGGSSVSMSTSMQLVQAPLGNALIMTANATATGLSIPVQEVGGPLVVQRGLGTTVATYYPNSVDSPDLSSLDGRTELYVPQNAAASPLLLRYSYTPGPGDPVPPDVAGRKRGFPTFYLTATDLQGQDVHQFLQPLTITVKYTPEELLAVGISEQDLTIFWYDQSLPGGAQWVPLSTNVDTTSHTASTQVDHFTPFKLSDGSSPSETYIPSLQGWQVGLYQGDVSYQYPIEVPAGPGGIKPNVSLSYNSAATDGKGGMRRLQQSGWAGKGWSLDTGYVALNKLPGQGRQSRYYSLVFDGQSFDLVRGAVRTGLRCEDGRNCPDLENPSHWEWHPTNEAFIRARAEWSLENNGYSTTSRGAYYTPAGKGPNGELPRFRWQVWSKSGVRYDFEEDVWQGFLGQCTEGFMETYKWHLTRVEDTHGNRINYSYGRQSSWRDECGPDGRYHLKGTIDGSVWPTEITWGSNTQTGAPDRYKVEFQASWRSVDTQYEHGDEQLSPVPHETHRLDAIKVHSKQAANWELVRQYNLTYETGSDPHLYLLSDYSHDRGDGTYGRDYATEKLTLLKIERVANNGVTALPPTTFTYHQWRLTDYYPTGLWNRLETVNNGQGGTITFTYDTIGAVLEYAEGVVRGYAGKFRNNRRVTSKVITDGRGNSYAWGYRYGYRSAAYNTIGTNIPGGIGPNTQPNSAALYYSEMKDRGPGPGFQVNAQTQQNREKVVHKQGEQFRGHSYAVETDPNGNETEHWFHQGAGEGVGCLPNTALRGDAIFGDPCFDHLKRVEFLKGREYRTITHAGTVNDPILSEVKHNFATHVFGLGQDGYADDRLSGLWRAFSYENQTMEWALDALGGAVFKTTNYTNDTTYGNLTMSEEIDASGVVRRTEHGYGSLVNATSYIVDRVRYDNVKDGQGRWLARTVYGYDGSWGEGDPGARGLLTVVRKYYNIPLNPPLNSLPGTGSSSDTTYGYDDYGNQTTSTTYAGPGLTGTFNSTPNYGVPGGFNTARTTTTTYDTTFHAFPTQVDPPVVNTSLAETATYDYRMGTLTSVTGPNGSTTTVNARYDVFGRMVKMWKPGDSEAIPTLGAYYYDNELPFKYLVTLQEVSGNPHLGRPILKFYDGLGREIQTKSESKDGIQHIVVDKRYDGLGRVTQQRQPRHVDNVANDPAFWNYVTPTWTAADKTTTTYDALGRVLTVRQPDTTVTSMAYLVNTTDGRTVTRTIDAKGHRTEHESDMLGRLIAVKEYNGTSSYTLDATTTYAYNSLDLLTTVTDTYSKTITMQYDSLGRKTSMTDLAMGAWSYSYDVNGNLKTQTDARNRVISFTYDALDRLESKSWPNYGNNFLAESLLFKYDQTGTGYSNGKGQRTSTIRCTGVAGTSCSGQGAFQTSLVQWQYDARGQNTSTTYTLDGLTGTRTMSQAYDSGGRVTSTTYPSGEVVNYTYDPGWRQKSACSSMYSPCYAYNANYTAFDQPSSFTLGNGLSQTYGYTALMKRLSSIQVVGSAGTIFNRGYDYDIVGNVWHITGSPTFGTQTFTYDQRDRLTNWTATGINETYTYDFVGNITSKAGIGYSYAHNNQNYGHPAGAGGPYAVRNGGYTYDANGNTLTEQIFSDQRAFTWNTENQPTQISFQGTTETYTYDADGARIKKVRGNVTTYYIGSIYEEEVALGGGDVPEAPDITTTRSMYMFNGQVVAQRSVGVTNTLIYLHSDHLGSVGAATSSTPTPSAALSSQEYDPWGKVRTGGVTQTKYNYTGQKLDDTGLLFYNARYYDSGLGRFVSPDNRVMGSSALIVAGLSVGDDGGTPLPQALNRYIYTANNPLNYIDPSGHEPKTPQLQGGDTGSYTLMLTMAHTKITQIVGGKNKAFNDIKGHNQSWRSALCMLCAGSHIVTALGEFGAQVCQGCPWDLKNDYRNMYGVPSGYGGVGGKDLYFSLGGAKEDDIAFSIFGNILFGYVGLAAGFSETDILDAGRREDEMKDPKGYNLPDELAYKVGFELYKKHKDNPAGLTTAELDAAIRSLVARGLVHTRYSIQHGLWCGPGNSLGPECR